MSGGVSGQHQLGGDYVKMRAALEFYGEALASRNSKTWDAALITPEVLPQDPTLNWTTPVEQRPAFERLTRQMERALGIAAPGQGDMAAIRYDAIQHAGLSALAHSASMNAQSAQPKPVTEPSLLIDSELIAIYW
jgi:hypothetical protein